MGTDTNRKGEAMLGKLTKFGLAAVVAGTMTMGAAFAQDGKPVKIGWAPWSDAEFVTKLAKKLIEDNLGQKVELVQTDVAAGNARRLLCTCEGQGRRPRPAL
jgi:ABC-type proline/glycine betaine transport system substrate-binding protein